MVDPTSMESRAQYCIRGSYLSPVNAELPRQSGSKLSFLDTSPEASSREVHKVASKMVMLIWRLWREGVGVGTDLFSQCVLGGGLAA